MNKFQLVAPFLPTGDQPEAIEQLTNGFLKGNKFQTLLGVTGSGKTFTMASIVEKLNRPTLVIAHNKTLAAQLYDEFKAFFPHNRVEYFVSYYDYYQPEAYMPISDTYIEKDSSINDEIEKLRHSATAALSERKDVLIVASVSCIYGLGSPIDYHNMVVSLRPGMQKDRNDMLRKLVEIQYVRNDMDFRRGTFRVRGDVVEIFPAYSNDTAFRVEFFGDEIDRIQEISVITGEVLGVRQHVAIYPASHYVTSKENMQQAIIKIEEELQEQVAYFKSQDKLVEAQRLTQRTEYDIEMLREMGFCSGIENYSRHMDGRVPGSMPHTLIDYFPDDFLIMVDESHQTIPQIGGMYKGDKSRKETLVSYGFRLPSALDNRPLKFDEFEDKINQMLFVSATPSRYEAAHENLRAEQVIRPTGLLDPMIEIVPTKGQIDHLIGEIRKTTENNDKVLVTTLTKKMAEDLTDYMKDVGIRIRYLHSDIDTLERLEIVRELRLGVFDVLVGINLLREGLDIPEVALVAILDADKQGFLRNDTSLVQTIGRAARNVNGRVIMYADEMTKGMESAISETNRRRAIQQAYNEKHHITPTSIIRPVHEIISATEFDEREGDMPLNKDIESMNKDELRAEIDKKERQMKRFSADLEFEMAILLREELIELKRALQDY